MGVSVADRESGFSDDGGMPGNGVKTAVARFSGCGVYVGIGGPRKTPYGPFWRVLPNFCATCEPFAFDPAAICPRDTPFPILLQVPNFLIR